MGNCLVCNSNAVINRQDSASRTIYNCQNCGMFVVSDLVEKELLHNINETASFLTSRKIAKENDIVLISFEKANLDKDYLQLTVKQIAELFPESFSEQMDMALKNLGRLSKFAGDEIKIEGLSMAPLFYVRKSNFEALTFIIKAMQKEDFIGVNYYSGSFFPCGIIISPRGWDRLHELEKGKTDRDIMFACAPREDSPIHEAITKATRKAARECGLQIVDNASLSADTKVSLGLIANIKSSKAVVCDFSSDSAEAYYAAALAFALNKICVLTCHNSSKSKLQLDTGQFSVIFWDKLDTLCLEIISSIKARL